MKNLILMLAVAGLVTSCNKDDGSASTEKGDSISLTAAIQDYQSAASRVLPYNNWAGLYDRNIALRIGDEVKEYHIDKDGNMTSETPFYWEGRSSVKVDVWYPYNEGAYSEEIQVYENQSITDNYLASDMVSVIGTEITPENTKVTVSHRVAKLSCKVTGIENLPFEAKMALSGVDGLHNGDEVTMTANYIALLAPQTIPAGKAVLKVIMDDLSTWSSAVIADEIVLEAGKTTFLEVAVSQDQVSVSVGESGGWNHTDGVGIDGESPTVTPDAGNGKWDHTEDNLTGTIVDNTDSEETEE